MAELCRIGPNDYRAIAAFLMEFPGGEGDLDFWLRRLRLWWDDNPAFISGYTRGWVLRDEGKRLVGFMGNVPSRFRVAGHDVRVHSATTWRVRPEHRKDSLRLYLAHVEAAQGELVFNTTPSEIAIKVLDFLRFASVPSFPSGRVYLLPLRSARTARAWLSRKKLPGLVGTLVGAPLWAAALPAALRLRARESHLVSVVPSAGEPFDALWERTKDLYAYTSVRGAAQLNWLCRGPFSRMLLAYQDGGVIRGYALFGDTVWRGLRVLELIDLWTDAANDMVAGALIAGGRAQAAARSYDLLVLHDFSEKLGALYRTLGIKLSATDRRRHYFRGQLMTPAAAGGPQGAYFSSLEGDRAL